MRTLIKPLITLQHSNKKGLYTVTAQLCKKAPHELTVKGRSHSGKDSRIFGTINRDGVFVQRKTTQAKGTGVLVAQKQKQIDTVLDLIFGTNRDKFPTINKYGQTEFKK